MDKLSVDSIFNLERILKDKDINNSLLFKDAKPKYKVLNSDGSLTLGATSYKWWNDFVGCQTTLSFNDLALHLIDFMAGVGKNRNEIALNGLYEDFVNRALKERNKNRLVDILLTSYLYGYKKIQEDGRIPSQEVFMETITKKGTMKEVLGLNLVTSNGPLILGRDLHFFEPNN